MIEGAGTRQHAGHRRRGTIRETKKPLHERESSSTSDSWILAVDANQLLVPAGVIACGDLLQVDMRLCESPQEQQGPGHRPMGDCDGVVAMRFGKVDECFGKLEGGGVHSCDQLVVPKAVQDGRKSAAPSPNSAQSSRARA